MMHSLSFDTPVGPLTLETDPDGVALARIRWRGARGGATSPAGAAHPVLAEARRQLEAYFARTLKAFDLPLAAQTGGPLECAVWAHMRTIPYGQTWTYGEMAKRVGSEPRAVGQACGANPIPIVVPCHRVMAADGRLGGFSGGVGAESKRALLALEGALLL